MRDWDPIWEGKSLEEWDEIWRLERLREDEMLAYRDQVEGRITNKALAEKFSLKATRVGLLVRRQVEAQERERLYDEIKRLKAERDRMRVEIERLTFFLVAGRLWMDLEWLATELEKRQ